MEKETFIYRRKQRKDMTLIIGMKYKEGIVLIGDTKISGRSEAFHENKIVTPVPNIQVAVGSAGFTQLAKEFSTKIQVRVTERLAEYRIKNMRDLFGTGIDIAEIESGKRKDVTLPYLYKGVDFLDDCATLTKKLSDTGKVYNKNPLESLVALFLPPGTDNPEIDFMLYQIDCNGFKVEVPFSSIGSGTDHIGDYLEKNYRKDISLSDAILLGTFLIKFVEVLEFDGTVGLEKGKLPQVFLMHKTYFGDYEVPKPEKDKILKEIETRLTKIRDSMHFFKGGKVKKPVWGKSKDNEIIFS